MTFPKWRTSGEGAPVDGDQEMAPAEEAAGAASVEVAAGADPANDQRFGTYQQKRKHMLKKV